MCRSRRKEALIAEMDDPVSIIAEVSISWIRVETKMSGDGFGKEAVTSPSDGTEISLNHSGTDGRSDQSRDSCNRLCALMDWWRLFGDDIHAVSDIECADESGRGPVMVVPHRIVHSAPRSQCACVGEPPWFRPKNLSAERGLDQIAIV